MSKRQKHEETLWQMAQLLLPLFYTVWCSSVLPSLHPPLPGPRWANEGNGFITQDETQREREEEQKLQVLPYFGRHERGLCSGMLALAWKLWLLCFEDLPVFPNALKQRPNTHKHASFLIMFDFVFEQTKSCVWRTTGGSYMSFYAKVELSVCWLCVFVAAQG